MKKIYIVMNEGEPVFASYDKEDAEGYADDKNYQGRREAMDEMGLDEDASPEEIGLADFKNGYDGGLYEVVKISSKVLEEDEFELDDGTEVNSAEIRSLLKRS